MPRRQNGQPSDDASENVFAAVVKALIEAFGAPIVALWSAILQALFVVPWRRQAPRPAYGGEEVVAFEGEDLSSLQVQDLLQAIVRVFEAASRSYDEVLTRADEERAETQELGKEVTGKQSPPRKDGKLAGVLRTAPKVLVDEFDACVKQAGYAFEKGDKQSVRDMSRSLRDVQDTVLQPLYVALGKEYSLRRVNELDADFGLEIEPDENHNDGPKEPSAGRIAVILSSTGKLAWQYLQQLWKGAPIEAESTSIAIDARRPVAHLNTQKIHRSCTAVISTVLRTLAELKGRLSWEISLRTLPPEVKTPSEGHSIASSRTSSIQIPTPTVERTTSSRFSSFFRRSHRELEAAADFTYNTLGDPLSIRLFQIESSSKVMKCSMQRFRLSEAPPYNALSYTWGASTTHLPILCNAQRLYISKSLHDALQRLAKLQSSKSRREKMWFWVDQVCINQQDANERAKQVRLMRLIYEKSERTLIWLGADDEGVADSAFSLVHDVYEACCTELQHQRTSDGRPLPGTLTSRDRKVFGLPSAGDYKWQYVSKILDRAWFTRVWCVQEVAVALSSPTLLFGKSECSWRKFAWATYWLHQKGVLDIPPHCLEPVASTFNLSFYAQQVWELASLLQITRSFHSSDPRDKIYGMLGLCKETRNFDDWPSELQPNYTQAVGAVFRDVTRYCVLQSRKLTLLSEAQSISENDPASELDDTLPSWVARFNEARPYPLLGFYDVEQHSSSFLAQRPRFYDASHNTPAVVQTESSPDSLILRGRLISQVRYCTFAKKSKISSFQAPRVTDYTPTLKLWALCKDAMPESDDDTLARALYITTTAGLNASLLRSTEDPLCHIYSVLQHELSNNPFASVVVKGVTSPDYFAERAERGDREFYIKALKIRQGRKFFVTLSGLMGLGPPALEVGDAIVVLAGGDLPFALRAKSKIGARQWRLVGECYVYGIMDGEAFQREDDRYSDEWFEIV